MWERSIGVPDERCQTHFQRFTPRGLGPLRLGLRARKLLMGAGQPLRRKRAWSWCVNGKDNPHAGATAVLTPGGKVALVAADAHGQAALGIEPGDSAAKLDGIARAEGGGLWTAKLGGRTVAYEVKRGKVQTVALATGPAAASEGSLRSYLKLVPAKVTRRPTTVIGSNTATVNPRRAIPYIAHNGTSPFPYFCGI
jgi:hypothetical protein